MAHMSGPALQELLSARGWKIPIVFISAHGDIPTAIAAIKAGAVDFVQKPYREQQLLDSINEALRRDAATRETNKIHEGFAERLATSSDREREVVDHVVKGQSNKSIAHSLGISHRTVELHRSHVLNKLGVQSVAELINLLNERSP
jgi:FixJ family two-component response regulator